MTIYEDVIDLRPYIQAIRKRWWLIALVTILVAAGAFAYSMLQVRSYEASATILLTRTRATLELANQFPTVNEPIDTRSRMDAMLEIAGSDALVVQT
ncbi:MAG: Wzz/FepE/Etk N-terminal domain-containing protein, partial [Anaerolineales bacterium]